MLKEKRQLLSIVKAINILSLIGFICGAIFGAIIFSVFLIASIMKFSVTIDGAGIFGKIFYTVQEGATDFTLWELAGVNSYKIVRYIFAMIIILLINSMSKKMYKEKTVFYHGAYKKFIVLAVFAFLADYLPVVMCSLIKGYVADYNRPFVVNGYHSNGFIALCLMMIFLSFLFKYGELLIEKPLNQNASNFENEEPMTITQEAASNFELHNDFQNQENDSSLKIKNDDVN